MNDDYRVNLQYSISLKELPGEVDRLIDKVVNQIKDCHTSTAAGLRKEKTQDNLSLKTVDAITKARDSLTAAVCALDDLTNIINGYIRYRSQPADPEGPQREQQSAQEAESPLSTAIPQLPFPMEELADKMKLFKQQYAGVENEEPHSIEGKEI
jgi:hypothetical protein